MPASTSSTNPCGPQSACPRKRAGSWGWSRARLSSGGVRPDVADVRDDRFGLGTVLYVVDVSLSAERVEGWIRATTVCWYTFALALVPDVPGCQEHWFSPTCLELANNCGCGVDDIGVGPSEIISCHVDDIPPGWGCFRPYPCHTGKKGRDGAGAPHVHSSSVSKVKAIARPDRHGGP